MKTKEIYKYEALIRYVKPNGEQVPPYKFLDVAKSTKHYSNIIKIILKDSINLIKNKNKRVSINISFEDISNEEEISEILEITKEQKPVS